MDKPRRMEEQFSDAARWRAAFAPVFDAASPDAPLDWCVVSHHLRDISLYALNGSPAVLTRGERIIDERPLDRILLVLCLDGRIEAHHAEAVGVVTAGGALALDLNRPFSLRIGGFTGIALMVPQAKAPAILRGLPFHGSTLDAGTPGAMLMARSAGALARAVAETTLDRGEALILTVLDMVADLLAAAHVARSGDVLAGTIAARHLRPQLARGDLSEALVAQLAGIAVADLQRLFGGRGGLREAVAALRVEAARRCRLVDRTLSERALARLVGYPGRAELDSDSRRRYGPAPEGQRHGRRPPLRADRSGTGAPP